jgi:hypothetical protein
MVRDGIAVAIDHDQRNPDRCPVRIVNFVGLSSSPRIAHSLHSLSMFRGQRYWRVGLSRKRICPEPSRKREPRRI